MARTFAIFVLLGLVAGCATSNGESTSEPEIMAGDKKGGSKKGGTTEQPSGETPPASDGDQSSGGKCTPKTCEQIGVKCGKHDDGCGGTTDCGACDPSCTPKKCTDLNQTCGKQE